MKRYFLKRDQLVGLTWLILGISLCIGSINLNLGSLHRPGPGLFPFLSGASLALLGMILMVSSITKRFAEKEEIEKNIPAVKQNWRIFLLTLLALFGYALLIEYLGFFSTTLLFFVFLFKLTNPKKWAMPLGLSVCAVIASYLLFSVWLKCQFPKGIFNF
jgi:putative tricarboxylic transport membrane protein